MSVEATKRVYIHIGDTRVNKYRVGKVSILEIWSHKDLGVILSHDLKIIARCCEGLRTLWALRQTFIKLGTTMFNTVYTTLIKTEHEYCVHATKDLIWKVIQMCWKKYRGQLPMQLQDSEVYNIKVGLEIQTTLLCPTAYYEVTWFWCIEY